MADSRKYTRETLLDLFKIDLKMPGDIDLELDAFVPAPRDPLAFQPLTEQEKRLLASASINSEMRRQHRPVRRQERVERVGGDRGDRAGGLERGERRDEHDLWDMPSGGGSFGADGIFTDSFNGPKVREVRPSDVYAGLNQSTAFTRPDPGVPQFVFRPPQWVYKDPEGQVQGPFSSEQMHGWYKDGYLPPGLPIKCIDDPMFIPLFQFVDKYGTEAPFLESLIEQEALERALYLQHIQMRRMQQQQQQQQQQHGRMNQRQIVPDIGLALRAAGIEADSALARQLQNLAPHEQQALLMYLTQQQTATGVQAPQEGQHSSSAAQSPSIAQLSQSISSPKTAPRVETAQQQQQQQRQPSPGPKAVSPSKSPVGQQKLPSPAAPLVPAVPFAPIDPPPRQASPKQKHSFPAHTSLQTAQRILGHDDTLGSPPEQAHAQQQPAKASSPANSLKSPGSAASKTSPASLNAWSVASESFSKLSLKEIQEKERLEQLERERIQEAKAQQKIMQEAQRIAQREQQQSSSIIPSQSTWGNKTQQAQSKKTLAEIMADEENQKGASVPGTAGKKYSDTIGPNPTGVWTGKTPAVVASGPVIKPQSGQSKYPAPTDHAWNTVGKPQKSASKPAAPPLKPESSSGASNNGASPEFISWCKAALADVQNESSTLSVPIKESNTIAMICDDALGGYSSIHPKKFAEAYITRRRADLSGGPSAWDSSTENLTLESDSGWTNVRSHRNSLHSATPPELEGFVSENKFTPVSSNSKKKKNKNKNK